MKRVKHLRSAIRFVVIVFFALIVLFAIFPLAGNRSALKRANADSSDAYPGVCLGGWENPGNAAGTPDVPPNGTSFTDQNSAVLNGEQAQIFCGSFQAGDQSETPTAVTLYLSWNVIFASQASSSVSTDTDSAAWSSVLDTTSSVTSTTDENTATSSATSSTPSVPSSPSASVAPTSSVPTSNASDDSAATSTSASSSTVTPPPAQPPSTDSSDGSAPAPSDGSDASSTDPSSTSLLQKIFSAPFALLVQRTFADSSDTTDTTIDTSTGDTATTTDDSLMGTSGDFMDVSYSLDGTTWTDLGQVNMSDWQNYSVTIPVSSWSDINNLQIQLSPDIGPDEPVVYLDGMWLAVDYNQSILGDLQDAASATINAVTDLSDTVDNALTDLLTPTAPTSTPEQEPAVASSTPLPPAPPPPPQHQYAFTLQGSQPIKGGVPAWAPTDVTGTAAIVAQAESLSAPTVSLPGANTIQVSGDCSAAYYTILIFPDAEDYEYNPSFAVYNGANKCVNGSFTQTIDDTDLPPQLASGTYYLVVGNQGVKGPWIPDPEIYPIQLNGTSDNASSSQ